ncbi:TRI55 protein, partial [Atractosteus spatula]|nr:TRI55 protein [Atractosteus spatula]
MEGLYKELSCPVCLELFSPPVLELPCSHNYCKQCITKTLISQNCTHVNGQFFCPMCRKVTCLRGRGIDGLKRNVFAENVLEKIKEHGIRQETRETRLKSQMCSIHEESINLMCLTDEKPICSICKLFGDHRTHEVTRLAEFYQEKKISFSKQMDRLLFKQETTTEAIQELQNIQDDLILSSKDIKTLISSLGESLVWEIQYKICTLNMMVDSECSVKCNRLQKTLHELQQPHRLYTKMKNLLDSQDNPIEFLKEQKILKDEAERLLRDDRLPQSQKKEGISVGKYVEELMKGLEIKAIAVSNRDSILRKIAEEYNAWRSGCSNVDSTSYDGLDQLINNTVSLSLMSPDETSSSLDWEISSSSEESDVTEEVNEADKD